MYRSPKYRVVGSVVTTTSGRTRRMSRTICSRTSSVGSSSPSSYPRNSTWSTPTTLADALASASRNSASRSRVISGSLDPAAPLVTSAYVTCAPSRTQRATVPAHPNSMSSGCAATTNALPGVQYSISTTPTARPPAQQGQRSAVRQYSSALRHRKRPARSISLEAGPADPDPPEIPCQPDLPPTATWAFAARAIPANPRTDKFLLMSGSFVHKIIIAGCRCFASPLPSGPHQEGHHAEGRSSSGPGASH